MTRTHGRSTKILILKKQKQTRRLTLLGEKIYISWSRIRRVITSRVESDIARVASGSVCAHVCACVLASRTLMLACVSLHFLPASPWPCAPTWHRVSKQQMLINRQCKKNIYIYCFCKYGEKIACMSTLTWMWDDHVCSYSDSLELFCSNFLPI